MLEQDAVERAAAEAVRSRVGWRAMVVHPSGRTGWTISYTSSSGRFVAVTVPVESDTTEADVQRLIQERLP